MDRTGLRFVFAAAFIFLAVTAARPAHAQLGPAADVDKCSLSEQQKSGDDCLVCRAYYRNSAHCAHALTDYGYARSCRMRGASMWREVWCRKKDPSARQLPPDLLASLDDATAGEPRADGGATASADDASISTPSPASTPSAAPSGEGITATDGATPVPPKGQASGCGTCAIGSRAASGSATGALAGAAGFALFFAFGARRRRSVNRAITPSRRDRSARS